MYIEKIHLRDWKSYVDETYEFPRPTRNKNVVLIGAKNGYGKTSLLEALMLCLYGREGLINIPRATLIDGDEQRLDMSYDSFLKRAFHGCALEAGRTSASVAVTLNDDGRKISISRHWYFNGAGRHRASEEEVRIYVDNEPFKAGRFDDRQDAVSNFIAKTFVPVYLAPFFLFDGEQVQRLANKEMAAQVRTGIEGLLGVGTLRELQTDLRSYSQNRRVGVPQGGDTKLDQLQSELTVLETDLRAAQQELASLEPKLPPLREAKEQKLRLLRSIAGGNSASIKELYDEKAKADARKMTIREQLLEFLNTDLALSIAGVKLRTSTCAQLRAEERRDSWIAGKTQGQEHLASLERNLFSTESSPEPPLVEPQLNWLRDRLRSAWEALWFPPPADCATDYRHKFLSGRERQTTISRIEHIDGLALGDLQNLTQGLTEAEQQIERCEGRIRELSGVEDQVKKLTDDIQRITEDEQQTNNRVQDLRRKCEGLKAQASTKRADIERVREQLGRSAPMMLRADKADRIANMIDALVSEMYPLKVREVGDAMTRIYRELAHKRLLSKVEITEDCDVQLLDKNGNDLRRFDASAGENQIFAVALISAIAEVSGAEVPMVVDTPLARLDEGHRMNVLTHLASQRGQVILLSATDEVTGQYYTAIEDRVAAGYHVDFEELEVGVGVSKVIPGYWGVRNGRRAIASTV